MKYISKRREGEKRILPCVIKLAKMELLLL